MNNLSELLGKLSEKEAESRIVPLESDPRVRAGVEALVRNAQAEIEKIEKEYKEAVLSAVVLIGVTGPSSQQFAEIAATSMKTMSIDYQLIKSRLVNTLIAAGAGGPYTSNSQFTLLGELQRVRLEYDMIRLPTPIVNSYLDGIYDSPVEVALTKLINNNYGDSLYSAVTRREIGKLALSARFDGKHLPVVVYNYTGAVDGTHLPTPITTVAADEPVTLNIVKKTLTDVKNLLKGNKSSKTIGHNDGPTEEDASEQQ